MINKKIKNKINFIKKEKKGFTLVETMVAVFILSFTITALMYVVSDSLFTARYSRNQITSIYLAQEASDFIRNDRDNYFLEQSDENWENFLHKYNNCISPSSCYFEVLDLLKEGSNIFLCNESTETKCPVLYYEQRVEPFYTYQESTQKSNFQRKITMIEGSSKDQNEIILTVTVLWKEGLISKETILKTILTKWQ